MQFQVNPRIPSDPRTVTINITDRASLMQAITDRLRAGQGFALATLNLDHLVKLAGSDTFRRAYAAQDLVVADGNPVVWLSRLAGRPVQLVPGADLVLPLARLAAAEGIGLALVGSTPEALDTAARRLTAQVPGLTVAACIAPAFGLDPEGPAADAVLAELGASGARICLLALGAPKQEILAARGRKVLPQMGFASIGAGVDFVAGEQMRAPALVRKLALEWLWRMALSPRRLLPRYARCAAILPGHAVDALRQRRRNAP